MPELHDVFREGHVGQRAAALDGERIDRDLGTARLAGADFDLHPDLLIAVGALHAYLVDAGGQTAEVDLPLRRRDPALGDRVPFVLEIVIALQERDDEWIVRAVDRRGDLASGHGVRGEEKREKREHAASCAPRSVDRYRFCEMIEDDGVVLMVLAAVM